MIGDIVIVGNGGFAREVEQLIFDLNQEDKRWNFLGFVCPETGSDNVFGNDEDVFNYKSDIYVVFAIGTPEVINRLSRKYSTYSHIHFPNLVHPSIILGRNVKLGEGNILCAGSIYTVDISIGNFNIFNLSCTIGHDTVLGNCNVMNPGVNCSGGVVIGDENLMGTNATILQMIKVGDSNKIGAGAVLTKDFRSGETIVGVPAKSLNKG